ncbi:hypothetical protein HDU78_002211 [Chytriomyces hyalinus]|nr:hypothetical protein HDU78_002211 [Chytriomyces hyalinus]
MNFIISLYVYLSIVYRREVAERYWYYYHVYVWGLSALLTGLVFVMEAVLKRGPVIGDATFECWISEEYRDLRIKLFYVPLWIHSAFIFAIYVRILLFLRSHRKKRCDENIQTGMIPSVPETNAAASPEASFQSDQKESYFKTLSIYGPGSNVSSFFMPGSAGVGSTPLSSLPKVSKKESVKGCKVSKPGVSSGNKMLLIKAGVMSIGFLISWVPASTARMLSLFPAITAPFWLSILSAVGLSTLGFWNPGVFFLTWFWPLLNRLYAAKLSNGKTDLPQRQAKVSCGGSNCGV